VKALSRSNQSGQAVIEYVLVLAVALSVVIVVRLTIVASLDKGVAGVGGRFERELRTGSLPASYWTK
jgi:Flp pilus assembly pilin Flp